MLRKKAIRAILRNKKAYLSCIILMALGATLFVMTNTALLVLEEGKDQYYEDTRLGDVFAGVTQMPESAMASLEAVEGIRQVDGRLIKNIRVIMPDNLEDVITLKLISVKPEDDARRLNNYVVYEGENIGSREDLLVGYDFYKAYRFEPGDPIRFILDGKVYNMKVQGGTFSPEYVYILKNPTDLFSDNTKYNVAFIDEEKLMEMAAMQGMYNDLSFQLEEGYDFDDVKDALEYELKKYGLIDLYDRDGLISYQMLQEEIRSGKSMSTSMPIVFVSMAAIVLYLMMRRLIEQERSQIGTLKAFGYSDRTILLHYIFYGFITGFVGAVVGVLIGLQVTGAYIQFYLAYYKMPLTGEINNFVYFYWGAGITILGGILGAYFGARHVVALNPAEAMRPIAPKPIHRDIIKTFPILNAIFTARGFMAARNILRNKVRSGFIITGIVFTYGMLTMVGMMNGVMDFMFYNQFTHVLKYDAEIGLTQSMPYDQAVEAVARIDGVTYAEGVMKTTIFLTNGFVKKGVPLTGIRAGDYLYKLYDDNLKYNIPLPGDGVVLSSMIAKSLNVKTGDVVYAQSPILDGDVRLKIRAVVDQSVGGGAWIDLDYLSELLDSSRLVNSLLIESDDVGHVREALINSTQVSKIEDKGETLQMLKSMLGSYDFLITAMEAIAILIGFTIIYNTAVISMSERSREYATLRVLGLTIPEVREIMSFEYWLLCVVGIVIGIPFAYMLNLGLQQAIDIDVFAWPSRIPLKAYFIAAIGCMAAVFLSNMTSVKAIKKLDLVEVLKERE